MTYTNRYKDIPRHTHSNDIHIPGHTHTKTYTCQDIHMPRHTHSNDIHIPRHTHAKTYTCQDIMTYTYQDIHIPRHTHSKTYTCQDIHIPRHTYTDRLFDYMEVQMLIISLLSFSFCPPKQSIPTLPQLHKPSQPISQLHLMLQANFIKVNTQFHSWAAVLVVKWL